MERSSVPFHQCSYFFSTFQRSGGLVCLRPRNYDFYEKLKVKFSSVTRNALNEQSHIFHQRIRTCTCAIQGVRNVSLLENFVNALLGL